MLSIPSLQGMLRQSVRAVNKSQLRNVLLSKNVSTSNNSVKASLSNGTGVQKNSSQQLTTEELQELKKKIDFLYEKERYRVSVGSLLFYGFLGFMTGQLVLHK